MDETERIGPERPRRGAFARFWAALPDGIRTWMLIGAGAAAIWTARGVWDRQIAGPARLSAIEDWKTEHDTWGHEKYSELTAQIGALEGTITSLQAQHDREIKLMGDRIARAECKFAAYVNDGSMVAC